MAGTYPINGVKVRKQPENSSHDTVYAPYAGAIACIVIQIDAANLAVTNKNLDRKITLPAGMVFKLNSIQVAALGTITSDPALTMGTSAAGTQIVASVNITSNLGALTLKATELSGSVYMRIANDTGDSISADGAVTINLVGHWQAPPTAMYMRNAAHF